MFNFKHIFQQQNMILQEYFKWIRHFKYPQLLCHRKKMIVLACILIFLEVEARRISLATTEPLFYVLNDIDKSVFLLSNCEIISCSAKHGSKMLKILRHFSRFSRKFTEKNHTSKGPARRSPLLSIKSIKLPEMSL